MPCVYQSTPPDHFHRLNLLLTLRLNLHQVLTRFGIGSASIKLVGRRDPYSMVMAIFDAIRQHQNIDEYAKDRGKRYLTLKWAYDQKL